MDQICELLPTLATIVLALYGWNVTHRDNLKASQMELQRSYRRKMFDAYFAVQEIFVNAMFKGTSPFDEHPELGELLTEARRNIQLYGHQNELELYERLIGAIETQDLKIANKAIRECFDVMIVNSRAELGLSKIDFTFKHSDRPPQG